MDPNTPILGGIGDFFSWLGGRGQAVQQYSQTGYNEAYQATSLQPIITPGMQPATSPGQYFQQYGQTASGLAAVPGQTADALGQAASDQLLPGNLRRDVVILGVIFGALVLVRGR